MLNLKMFKKTLRILIRSKIVTCGSSKLSILQYYYNNIQFYLGGCVILV